MSLDRDERPEYDEPEGSLEEYVKPRLLNLGTLADTKGSGPPMNPDPGGMLGS